MSGVMTNIVLGLRGEAGSFGGFGVGLNMVELLDQWSRHRSLLNELGGGCTRVSRPGIKEPGAPKCPTHSHQIADRNDLEVTLASLEIYRAAKPDRCMDSDAENVRDQGQDTQAGGFWRSCRQRRKAAWLSGTEVDGF
ncbi:hypothetical protein D3C84_676460 [compost metagenome]